MLSTFDAVLIGQINETIYRVWLLHALFLLGSWYWERVFWLFERRDKTGRERKWKDADTFKLILQLDADEFSPHQLYPDWFKFELKYSVGQWRNQGEWRQGISVDLFEWASKAVFNARDDIFRRNDLMSDLPPYCQLFRLTPPPNHTLTLHVSWTSLTLLNSLESLHKYVV